MNEKILKDAQYRKGLSIAFFNATNAAVEFAKINGLVGIADPKRFIAEWRDFFLEEHKAYYANVIANVGANFNVAESIKKITEAGSMDVLISVWLGLSEDERRDSEILKAKDSMKKKYAKTR